MKLNKSPKHVALFKIEPNLLQYLIKKRDYYWDKRLVT